MKAGVFRTRISGPDWIPRNNRFSRHRSSKIHNAELLHQCLNKGSIELGSDRTTLNLEDDLQINARFQKDGWFYLLAIQKQSLEVFPWRVEGGKIRYSTSVQTGIQVLPSDKTYWEVDFKPGKLLLLGVWVEQAPNSRFGSTNENDIWRNWIYTNYGQIDTALLELQVQ